MSQKLDAMFVNSSDPPGHHGKEASNQGMREFTWGIFTIVYDLNTTRYWRPRLSPKIVPEFAADSQAVITLFCETFKLAPIPLLLHLFATIWGAFPALFSLYTLNVLLQLVVAGIALGTPDHLGVKLIFLTWTMLSIITTAIDWLVQDTTALLRSHLRIHFLPRLVDATVSLDMKTLQDPAVSGSFPREYLFEDAAPGWEALSEGCRILASVLNALAQIVVIFWIILRDDGLNPGTCPLVIFGYIALRYFRKSHGSSSKPYVFYSENPHYKRLSLLYRIAFGLEIRESLVSEGGARYVRQEYRSESNALGVGKNEPSHLRFSIPWPWYVTVWQQILVELPLLCIFCQEIWMFTPTSLTCMLLLWQANNSLRGGFQCDDICLAFRRAVSSANALYSAVNMPRSGGTGNLPYPGTRSTEGANLSMRNVSFAYPAYDAFSNKPRTILREICCDFLPGSLTLIVGRNGSGKSTLLKLMSGIYTPTSGDLLLDDCPLRSFREDDLRQAIYRVPQEPQIYPLSLRENLQIGLAQPPDQASLGRAVKEAGIADLVGSLRDGFDTLMGPLVTSYRGLAASSLDGTSETDLSPQLNEEYLKHFRPAPTLSRGETQRLALTRTIVRLEHSDVRLLLVDEPASALDPVAELDFCTKLRNSSKGRTVVVVSHRFAQLAKRADMILCMKDGKIVERGTHEELMGVGGEYWELYNAQHASD